MIQETLTLGAEVEEWEQSSSHHCKSWLSSSAFPLYINWHFWASVSPAESCSCPCHKKQVLSSLNSLENSIREINVGCRGRRAVNFSPGLSSWHTVTILNHFHTRSSAQEIPPPGGFPIPWFGLSHSGKHSRKTFKGSPAESFDTQLRRQRQYNA